MRSAWLVLVGLVAAPFAACGPDEKPQAPCRGPSINLVLRAENAPLPEGTRINVRYGGNRDGEPYLLGQERRGPAVFCDEDRSQGGASSSEDDLSAAGAGGAGGGSNAGGDVWKLVCGLYTQGPARLDATADGYEPIDDLALSLEDGQRCEVPIDVKLRRLTDAGM
jgi:hypothetical protein